MKNASRHPIAHIPDYLYLEKDSFETRSELLKLLGDSSIDNLIRTEIEKYPPGNKDFGISYFGNFYMHVYLATSDVLYGVIDKYILTHGSDRKRNLTGSEYNWELFNAIGEAGLDYDFVRQRYMLDQDLLNFVASAFFLSDIHRRLSRVTDRLFVMLFPVYLNLRRKGFTNSDLA